MAIENHIETIPEDALIRHDPELKNLWTRIREFQLDDETALMPFSKSLARDAGWSDEFTQLAIMEYRKFMLLAAIVSPIVPSVHIDTVWHCHLLYTRSYRQFCREALCGEFFHHEPSKGRTEDVTFHSGSYDETIAAYEKCFGATAPSAIWGERVRSKI